jgi:hypothetical protein
VKHVIALVLLAALICVAGIGCGDTKKSGTSEKASTGATSEKK